MEYLFFCSTEVCGFWDELNELHNLLSKAVILDHLVSMNLTQFQTLQESCSTILSLRMMYYSASDTSILREKEI